MPPPLKKNVNTSSLYVQFRVKNVLLFFKSICFAIHIVNTCTYKARIEIICELH